VKRWRAWLAAQRSDAACAQCGRPERPWRRMLWYPFPGTLAGAFICSDACWDELDRRMAA